MKRQIIPEKTRLVVWQRDNWHCRYCGEPVFYAPALKALDELNPGHLYFHPNGKSGKMLPLFQWRWASVDHVVPASKGGSDSVDNYVTACWECNLKYRDNTEGKPGPLPIKKSDWDGFYGALRKKK